MIGHIKTQILPVAQITPGQPYSLVMNTVSPSYVIIVLFPCPAMFGLFVVGPIRRLNIFTETHSAFRHHDDVQHG